MMLMLKSVTSAMLALVMAVPAWAVLLPGGTPADQALREGALAHNVERVKDALKKGANPNSPSDTGRRITPLGAGNGVVDP
jgi:hypothetical protein